MDWAVVESWETTAEIQSPTDQSSYEPSVPVADNWTLPVNSI